MFKIKLFGVIDEEFFLFFGSDDIITLSHVQSELKKADGQDLEVDFSSVGGLVDVAVDILLEFRDYKRQFPNSQMILNIKSQCASAGSLIAAGEFWDITTVEDISSWMIHNPSNFIGGDYRIMKRNAEHLERLAILYSTIYQKKSGKSERQIRKMMDDITFLYGQEIIDAGFADEILETNSDTDKSTALAMLDLNHKEIMKKSRDIEIKEKDFEKVAAIMKDEKKIETSIQPASGGENNNQEEITMKDSNELKEKFPTVHADVMKAGEDKGIMEMKANNKAIMEFKNKDEFKNLDFIQERCDQALENGETMADLKMAVQALMLDPKNQASLDSPGDIGSGGGETVSGEEGATNPAREF